LSLHFSHAILVVKDEIMFEINWTVYHSTREQPGGPTILMEQVDMPSTIELYEDEDGHVSTASYHIRMVLLFGLIAYIFFR
jgi:hypothetical protein